MVDANTNVIRKMLSGMLSDITDELESLRQSSQLPNYYRAVIEEVLFDPLDLDTDDKDILRSLIKDPFTLETIPRNAIIAKRVRTKGETNFMSELFFPFLPSHLLMPIKPGETIWVFYDNMAEKQDNGYWMWRVSERRDVEDVNYTHSDRRFFPPPGKVIKAGEKAGVKKSSEANPLGFPNGLDYASTHSLPQTGKIPAFDDIVNSSTATALSSPEPVPRYTSRPGDMTLQGSNNTLINLGRKRTGPAIEQAVDGEENIAGLGAIDIAVGRGQSEATSAVPVENTRETLETDKSIGEDENKAEGDPDFENDSARIYLAMNMSTDEEFGIEIPEGIPFTVSGLEGTSGVNSSDIDRSAVVVKADQLRFISRSDIKLQVVNPDDPSVNASVVLSITGDILFIPDTNGVIKLGGTDADKAILVTDSAAVREGGEVTAPPVQTTMGGLVGTTASGQGTWASKILAK